MAWGCFRTQVLVLSAGLWVELTKPFPLPKLQLATRFNGAWPTRDLWPVALA